MFESQNHQSKAPKGSARAPGFLMGGKTAIDDNTLSGVDKISVTAAVSST